MDAGTVEAALVMRDLASKTIAEIEKALGGLTKQLDVVGKKTASAGEGWDDLSRRWKTSATSLSDVGKTLTTRVTLPLGATGAMAVKVASDFESTFTKINTLAGVSAEQMAGWSDRVLGMSRELGKTPQELADGLLVVTSAGARGAEALDILRESAKASAIGLGETNTIARAVTAAMQAYGKDNLSAAEATRILIATVREGNAEASEMAGTLGRVIGIASQVGVSFQEVGSFMATFTRLGVDSAEAVTALRGMLSTLIKPSDQAREQLTLLGTSIEKLRSDVQTQGLTGAMIGLAQATKGNVDAIGEIIPNVRALAGFLGTAGAQASQFAEIQRTITAAAKDQAFTDNQLAKTKQTLAFRFNELKAAAAATSVAFGSALLPVMKAIFEALKPVFAAVGVLAEGFNKLPNPIKVAAAAMLTLVAAVGPAVWAFGTLKGNLATIVGSRLFQTLAAEVVTLRTALASLATANVAATLTAGAGQATLMTRTLAYLSTAFTLVATTAGRALGAILDPVVALATRVPLLNAALGRLVTPFGLVARVALAFVSLPGLIAAGIAALAAVILKATNAWDPFVDAVGNAVGILVQLGRVLKALIGMGFEKLASLAREAGRAVADMVPDWIGERWRNFSSNLVHWASLLRDKLAQARDWLQKVADAAGAVKLPEVKAPKLAIPEPLRLVEPGTGQEFTADKAFELGQALSGLSEKMRAADQAAIQFDLDLAGLGRETLVRAIKEGERYGWEVDEIAAGTTAAKTTIERLKNEMAKHADGLKDASKATTELAEKTADARDYFDKLRLEITKLTQADTARILGDLTRRMEALAAPLLVMVDLFGQLKDEARALRIDVSLGGGGNEVLAWMEKFSAGLAAIKGDGELAQKALAQLQENAALELRKLAQGTDYAALGFRSLAEMIAYIGQMAGIDYRKFLPPDGAFDKLLPARNPWATMLKDLVSPNLLKDVAKQGSGIVKALFASFGNVKDFAGGLSQTIMGALKGGGKLGESIGGFLGGGIGDSLSGSLGKAMENAGKLGAGFLSKGFGKVVGGALGSILPGLGNLLGAGLGGLFDKVFGGLFGGDAKKTKKMRNEFLAAAGGLDKVREMAQYAGVSVDKLLSTKKSKTFEAEVKKLEAAFAAAQERVKALVGDLQKLSQEGAVVGRDMWKRLIADKDKPEVKEAFVGFFKEQADKVAGGFNAIASGWAGLAEKGSKAAGLLTLPLERVGLLAEAAFGAMLAKGASLVEAIAAIAPGLARIQEGLAKTGGSAGGMLGQLLGWQAVIDKNKELFEILGGVDDMLVGLGNTGMLTQETFGALAATMSDAFNALVAQGVSGEDALRMMAPQLQKLWELQQQWGFEIDSTTQAMIDQAKEQGIVGEKMKGVNDKILDVLVAIADVLGAKIPDGLKAMGEASGTAARTITDNLVKAGKTVAENLARDFRQASREAGEVLGRIKVPTLRGRVMWDVDAIQMPDAPTLGVGVDVPQLAVGGIVTRPSLATIGEAGPEAVVPLAKLEQWIDRLATPEASQAQAVTLNVTITALDTKSVRQAVEDEVLPIITETIRGNIRGARTNTRLALGIT